MKERAITQSIHFSACVCLILSVSVVGLAQRPELIVQTGHSESVASVAFSPDGTLLASASGDRTIKLWDVVSGQDVRTLTGHSEYVASVVFSPDGKLLASGSGDAMIKLWDVASGQDLSTLAGHSASVTTVAFSPNGKLLASSSYDKTIKLWEVASRQEVRNLSGHSADVNSVAFSPDGTLLASGSYDRTIKLWDVASGQDIRTLSGHSESVTSVAFSPDGKLLASGSLMPLRRPGVYTMIKLWEAASGKEIRTLSGHSPYFEVAFSPDGKVLASGSWDKRIELWDVKNGQKIKTVAGHSESVNSIAFSPDGKLLASGSDDSTIKLWDVASGQEIRTLSGHSKYVTSVAFSPDGKLLAGVSGYKAIIKLWDVVSGQDLRTLIGHSESITSVAFSPDSKVLAVSGFKTIKLWDVASGQEIRTLSGHSESVTSVTFSPDGKLLASASRDATIKLWDVAIGKEIRTLSGHSNIVTSITFRPDGKVLASGSWDQTIKVWDVATGQEVKTLSGDLEYVESVVFSPDGRLLASGSGDDTFKLWDVASAHEINTLSGHSAYSKSAAFSPDGKLLASGGWDKMTNLWDVVSGREIRTSFAHSHFVPSAAFSPDGKLLVSGSWDTKIKVWEISSGKELASLIALDEKDWIVVTPDGLFDGSPAGWNKVIWRFNNNTFDYKPVEVFFSDFYYPGLLTDIFAGKRPKALSDIARKDRRQPQLKLSLANAAPATTLTARNVSVKIDVSQAPAGVQDVRLFRNGSLVKAWRGDVLKGQSNVTLEATLPIVAGENRLTAYAFNHDNIKSSDVTLVINGADSLKRAGTLYVLAVGVGQYANPNYNLNYTPADARSFGDEMRRQQALLQREKLGRYAHVEVIPLLNQEATKANILLALRKLSGAYTGRLSEGVPPAIAELHASQPEDGVILYFSGHGTAQKDRFYLIPHDLGYKGAPKNVSEEGKQMIFAHSISDVELEEAFREIDGGQLLLIIDACNSGQALQAEDWRRGPMNTKGLAQLAYEKGMYVLTASQSIELAYESEALKRSYMTYALIEEGLKSRVKATDTNKDGQVWLREWFDYAVQRVPRMREEKIQQTAKQGNKSLDVVEVAEQGKMQTPRVFYRREPDAQPWVVAQSK